VSNVLEQIIVDKRAEVAARRAAKAPTSLAKKAAEADPPRDFFAAVTAAAPPVRVIAEVKRASPSAGLIRPDFDPATLAAAYADAGAAAISCLTDEKYFQGRLEFIAAIRAAVPLPVLRKDFIIDSFQVDEARVAGADAVLLIAECIDDDVLLRELATHADRLGMASLIEIYEPANLDRVLPLLEDDALPRVLLGINNRDLRSMTTDLAHTINLLPRIPDPSRLVSESGIRTHDDIEHLLAHGVGRVLVGEHLMRQADVAAALRDLIGG